MTAGANFCPTCPHRGTVKSPISLARRFRAPDRTDEEVPRDNARVEAAQIDGARLLDAPVTVPVYIGAAQLIVWLAGQMRKFARALAPV